MLCFLVGADKYLLNLIEKGKKKKTKNNHQPQSHPAPTWLGASNSGMILTPVIMKFYSRSLMNPVANNIY